MTLKAGRIKYRMIDENFKDVLIDGTNVFENLWTHIEFTITFGYLDQQVIDVNLPQNISIDLTNAGFNTWDAEVDLSTVLSDLKAGNCKFFPRLEDQFGAVDTTNYDVVPTKDTYELLDARKNGRFNTYTPLSFITKTPLAATPTWINR